MSSDKGCLLAQKFSVASTQCAAPASVDVQTITAFEVICTTRIIHERVNWATKRASNLQPTLLQRIAEVHSGGPNSMLSISGKIGQLK